MNNSVGDMLIRIKNAYLSRHKNLELPYSRFRETLAKILLKEGYLEKVSLKGKEPAQKTLKIDLKYQGKKAALRDIKQISKPGLKVYIQARDIWRLERGGFELAVISTPKGLMTHLEAKKKNLGGELICQVW